MKQAQNGTTKLSIAPSRMSLTSLVKGRIDQPLRVVIYGTEGIGKSTFGASAPSPIFLGPENGTGHLNVTRFPSPQSWVDVLDAIRVLTDDAHDYKTLVIDSLDWLEPVLFAYICQRDGQAGIEAYGYGKGYTAALDEWRVFLKALERLRHARPMHVILVAHAWIKTFSNPAGENYDRYEMKLNNKAAGLIKEWVDCVLFANYETFANKTKRESRAKGVDSGARLLYTQWRAAYDAKNRHGLPESLPLSWDELTACIVKSQDTSADSIIEKICDKAKGLSAVDYRRVTAAIDRAEGSKEKLAQLENWVVSKLEEVEPKEKEQSK